MSPDEAKTKSRSKIDSRKRMLTSVLLIAALGVVYLAPHIGIFSLH